MDTLSSIDEKRMLSITDENVILITIEFLNRIVPKADKPFHYSHKIDLIVHKKTTCEDLLKAIKIGLGKKTRILTEEEEKSIENEKTVSEYRYQTMDDTCFKSDIERYLMKMTDDDIYKVCQYIFLRCYKAFEKQNSSSLKRIKNDEPRIGRGSINYLKLQDGETTSVSDKPQIIITQEDLHKTLDELGFMTASRLIFDISGKHYSTTMLKSDHVIEPFRMKVPLYNISAQPIVQLDNESVKIIPPTDPPQLHERNPWSVLLTPLIMGGMLLGSRFMFSGGLGNSGWIGMSLIMTLTTAGTSLFNFQQQRKDHKKALNEWRDHYEAYISNLIEKIKKKQAEDIIQLKRLYPPAYDDKHEEEDLICLITKISGLIFSRGLEHPDFLVVRIGKSVKDSYLVPSVFKIEGEKKEVIFSSVRYKNLENTGSNPFTILMPEKINEDERHPYLNDLPAKISDIYSHIVDAPVLLKLKECGSLGVVLKNHNMQQEFLDNIVLNLCFYHSPDHLQFVWFCNETNLDGEKNSWGEKQAIIDKYKHLPHFIELFANHSQFVFNESDASTVLNRLLNIINSRKQLKDGIHLPHIIVIIQDEYNFKHHLVAEFLKESMEEGHEAGFGITFIFFKDYIEELPKYCSQIIKVDENSKSNPTETKWYLLPKKQLLQREKEVELKYDLSFDRYRFQVDPLPPQVDNLDDREFGDRYYSAFKILSSLYYERIAQDADVPERLSLFSLLNDYYDKIDEETFNPSNKVCNGLTTKDDIEKRKEEHRLSFVERRWKNSSNKNITKSLRVPIGEKAGNKIVYLDLYEKEDGPHMLIAGTTGSGKTETVLTYLVNLCAIYTPEEVNLLLVDMKAGEFVNRLAGLPHIVGTVTDVEGDENGTGSAYMLGRFLKSMTAEIKRRKLQINQLNVDSIDSYIKKRNELQNKKQKWLSKLRKLLNKKLEVNKKKKYSGKKQKIEFESNIQIPDPLPHLFVVIDEFTELMQFSSENDGIDFKKEITSLSRIGRSLGFHIILISQNIENAITDDIRANSRARLCLRVATREASKAMIGTDLAGSPHMPGNGRAYLLVGTGSRFDYFQSAYSGDDTSEEIIPAVLATHATTNGEYEPFYISTEDNEKEKKANKARKYGKTQLEGMISIIRQVNDKMNIKGAKKVFQSPLPTECWLDYDYSNGNTTICKKES